MLKTLLAGGEDALLLVLGRRVAFPASLTADRENCGLAEWLLDKTSKNFVLMLSRSGKRSWACFEFGMVGW